MKEIFSKLPEYKRIQLKTLQIQTKQQKALIKQLSKINPNTKLTLILQKIENEPDTNHLIKLFVECADHHEIDFEIVKRGLIYFKKSTISTYDSIRVLLKLREFQDDFLFEYVDNDLLAIVMGEYIRKYEKPINYILNFPKFIPVMFISYVTILNFSLVDNFDEIFTQAYKILERENFEEICVVLIKFMTCEKSIQLFQESLKNILESVKEDNIYLNNFVLGLIIEYQNFFKMFDFISELAKMLRIYNLEIFGKFMKIRTSDDNVTRIIQNSSPEMIYNFFISASKSHFIDLYEKVDLSVLPEGLLLDMMMMLYYYKPDYVFSFKTKVNDIRSHFLKNGEDLNFSESFVNGLSFADKKYKYKESDINQFIYSKKDNINEYKTIFHIIEYKCFLGFLLREKLVDNLHDELKTLLLANPELRCHVLKTLMSIDKIYGVYLSIENINRNRIKEIKIGLEALYHKVTDKDFYFDYMFVRSEILGKMKLFKTNPLFIERIKQMKNFELKADLCKMAGIEYKKISNPKIEKRTLNLYQEPENKENIQIKKQKIEQNIIFYLNNEIEMPFDYVLSKQDLSQKNRIQEKITALLIKIVRNEQMHVGFNSNLIPLICNAINLFGDVNMLISLMSDMYKFYRSNNLKATFKFIVLLLKEIKIDIYESRIIVQEYLGLGGSIILEPFIDKLKIDEALDFYNNLTENARYKIRFVNVFKSKIEQNEEQKKSNILKLLNHDSFKAEGLHFYLQYLPKDEDCIYIAQEIVESQDEPHLLDAINYLVESGFKLNNDLLYDILFKRAKLDDIGCAILEIIDIEEEHLERLYEFFHLNPIKYINFLPRIINYGYEVTDDMSKELILILKNIYDETDRLKIMKIMDNVIFENNNEICQCIISDLEDVNYKSKVFLIKTLDRIYVNSYEMFIEMVKVVGNEDSTECLLLLLSILKKHRSKFYSKMEDWKSNENLSRALFRLYPLDMKDKEFYKKICLKYKKAGEYAALIKFYENELV